MVTAFARYYNVHDSFEFGLEIHTTLNRSANPAIQQQQYVDNAAVATSTRFPAFILDPSLMQPGALGSVHFNGQVRLLLAQEPLAVGLLVLEE